MEEGGSFGGSSEGGRFDDPFGNIGEPSGGGRPSGKLDFLMFFLLTMSIKAFSNSCSHEMLNEFCSCGDVETTHCERTRIPSHPSNYIYTYI